MGAGAVSRMNSKPCPHPLRLEAFALAKLRKAGWSVDVLRRRAVNSDGMEISLLGLSGGSIAYLHSPPLSRAKLGTVAASGHDPVSVCQELTTRDWRASLCVPQTGKACYSSGALA